ncbi:GNAT family N-acetyltransferase [Amycolatopsis rubida]|uniref:GNAT family N-acetyltransferase n=1 Tax=Amycolatopsis rubida TaxID=112413 RepID=A0ABX0C852_9PSEU|nr:MULTISPECIES: GNAT family N-acetyltransferase [Amycolatopsis]MYW97523.1 GNAT family N-acetyltransferase [Amycolatopsis rubida]NEC62508.1 GNAT family N-acetyltransferase [Amycolatopsis rubida]OAP27478.1 putative N-acetyltransferase YjaB [Amycolatopsis sp. M39]
MTTLRPSRGEAEYPRLLEIWRSAVEATHHFLAPADVEYYATRVPVYFPQVDVTVAEVDGILAGFSGIAEGKLEMLFVHDDFRGRGVGSALLRAALDRFPGLTLDVNEQNPRAVGFYLHHGFEVVGRQETDSDGRPFPLLELTRA